MTVIIQTNWLRITLTPKCRDEIAVFHFVSLKIRQQRMMIDLGGDFSATSFRLCPRKQKIKRKTFFLFFTQFARKLRRNFTSFQTFTGSRASIAMLDERLLCDTEFVVVAVADLDSVATFSFCSPLRASSQTFSTLPPFCCCWLACVLRGWENIGKSLYHRVGIETLLINNH